MQLSVKKEPKQWNSYTVLSASFGFQLGTGCNYRQNWPIHIVVTHLNQQNTVSKSIKHANSV